MFSVGQQVVYIDNRSQLQLLPGEIRPTLWRIYTVRALVMGLLPDGSRHPGLLLDEIVNPASLPDRGYEELNFRQERFRPVERLPDEALAELLECLEPAHA